MHLAPWNFSSPSLVESRGEHRKEQMCADFAKMRRVLLSERARIKCTRVRSRRRRLSDLAATKKRGAERKRCAQMRHFDAHARGER